MNADREFLHLYLSSLNVGLEMDSPLIVVVPTIFVQLDVLASVVDVPVILEPARLHQTFFEITEDCFGILHLSITRQ